MILLPNVPQLYHLKLHSDGHISKLYYSYFWQITCFAIIYILNAQDI